MRRKKHQSVYERGVEESRVVSFWQKLFTQAGRNRRLYSTKNLSIDIVGYRLPIGRWKWPCRLVEVKFATDDVVYRHFITFRLLGLGCRVFKILLVRCGWLLLASCCWLSVGGCWLLIFCVGCRSIFLLSLPSSGLPVPYTVLQVVSFFLSVGKCIKVR